MNKAELAQYLVNLQTLLQAQTSSVHPASAVLSAEYDKSWALLKETIAKEKKDE